MKSAVEFIEKWRIGGDLPYQMLASAASILVVVSVHIGRRPSELLAELFGLLGVGLLERGLGVDSPPVLAVQSPVVQQRAMTAAFLIVIVMVLVPLWRGREDPRSTSDEAIGLVGSRSAATVWLVVLVAVQQGPVVAYIEGTHAALIGVAKWSIAVLALVVLLAWTVHRIGLGELLWLPGAVVGRLMWRVLGASGGALAAVLFVLLYLPMTVLAWTLEMESDSRRRARAETARRMAEAVPSTAGAVQLPVR